VLRALYNAVLALRMLGCEKRSKAYDARQYNRIKQNNHLFGVLYVQSAHMSQYLLCNVRICILQKAVLKVKSPTAILTVNSDLSAWATDPVITWL